ncbi:copper-translocating P-type ATPase [Thioalkalivibrio denitrificans]|uniref:Copper-translocating P-type ATPase n=1 Tax=Thioalkalivibrio denitrificans TaxID=108003 RepID=A0A1V3NDD6_9GAMM|nr:heavy metal translocating P-type ATPase [Thioalkalivibrio denitrificans]OOG23080.1 copper-translocating P-type ATPase [Thioalkalivibrio denitrificans]
MNTSRSAEALAGAPDTADEGCFHCGLPVPPGASYPVTIEGSQRAMCCPGCQAVARAIVDAGLEDYYRHRTVTPEGPADPMPERLREELSLYDRPELQQSFVQADDSTTVREAALILEGIVCAACVWLNERHVKSLPGVLEFAVNYSTHRARLRWDDARIHLSDILQAIREIGYRAHPFDPGRQEEVFRRERQAALRRLAVAGLGMMQVMMVSVALWIGGDDPGYEGLMHFLRWVAFLIATPVVLYAGSTFFTSAWRDLSHRQLGMDVPVALAIGSTYLASGWGTITGTGEVYFESVTMFVFFLLTGRYLEMGARQRAGQATEALGKLLPAMAIRITPQGDEPVPVADLAPGDRVRVRPGDTVPADGTVLEGRSSVNEAMLTGESLPRARGADDELTGGTVNVESPLVMRVDRVGADTMLSAIQRLLDRAQTEKPRLARMAERGTGAFVAAVLILTALVGAVWWFGIDPSRAFWVMVAMLVVSCPCALALATPVAMTAATGSLTGRGVLVTRGHALETLAAATDIVFDKTGTLTEGQLERVHTELLGDRDEAYCLGIAAVLEQGSEHPVARVFQRAGTPGGVLSDQRASPGQGMEGRVDGRRYRMGSAAFVRELAVQGDWPSERMAALAKRFPAASLVLLGDETGPLAAFVLEDRLREDAAACIAALRDAGLKVHLLSGDHPDTVQYTAARVGIESASGGLDPDGKLRALEAIQARPDAVVAMVGDGINDAPVLARAHVSIAMAEGTQLAQASADMILYGTRLGQLPAALGLAGRMVRVVRQNIRWAIGYNVIALPVAASGILTPWMAALGMSLSSLIVVVNSLRLREEGPRGETVREPGRAQRLE